ncbi:MAG: hypothetical protein IT385_26990 [Deltaproteobacteria bacterium]|nr:hypothetical protein [Deltaproteobacteria bacterium]
MKRTPNLRVMAEYGSSGIWGSVARGGIFRHGMIEHAALGLPADLAAAFDAWIRRYEDEGPSGRLDAADFNREGLALAVRLAEWVGPGGHVEYQGEAPDGGLAPAIVVT